MYALTRGVFRKEGDHWTIIHEDSLLLLEDMPGLRHLSLLLPYPQWEVHVSDLLNLAPVQEGWSAPSERDVFGAPAPEAKRVLDATTKAAYTRRLDELLEQVEVAARFNDTHRAERLRLEMDLIAIRLAVGLGLDAPSALVDPEHSRLIVTAALRAAIARIRTGAPALGHHLSCSIQTGYFCSYQPDAKPFIKWQVS